MPDRKRGRRFARRLTAATIGGEHRGMKVIKIITAQRLLAAMGEEASVTALEHKTDETYHATVERAVLLLKMLRGPG